MSIHVICGQVEIRQMDITYMEITQKDITYGMGCSNSDSDHTEGHYMYEYH